MKITLRALALAMLMIVGVGLTATPASADHCRSRGNAGNNAATYSGAQSDIGADKSQGRPGDRARVHGCGFNPSTRYTVDFNSTPVRLAEGTTDANGAFDIEVTIPADASVGRHTITATGTDPQGRAKVESVAFTIVTPAQAANAGAGATTLPRTGTSTVPLIAGSTVLVGLGAVLVIAARRRRALEA
jgi:LPXTG-motif cell wall-anchored protein